MERNMGNIDRILRAALIAPVLIVLGVVVGASSVGGVVLFALAGIMLVTAAIGWCPLYLPFHLSTCPTNRSH